MRENKEWRQWRRQMMQEPAPFTKRDVDQARRRIRQRLGFVVQHIDAGLYRYPEKAADEIIDVLLSVYPEHRNDLRLLMEATPMREERP